MAGGWGGAAGTSKPVLGFDPEIFSRVFKELKSHLAAKENFDLNSLYFLLYAFAEKKYEEIRPILEKKLRQAASLQFSDFGTDGNSFSQAAETARLLLDAFSVFQIDEFLKSSLKLVEILDSFYNEKLGAFAESETDAAFTFQNAMGARTFFSVSPHLQNQKIREKAERALKFIQERLYDPLLGLIRRFPFESKELEYGYLDDYAASFLAFIDGYLQSVNKSYRVFADVLAKSMLQELWNREKGGFLSHVKADSSQEKISKEALLNNAQAFEALWRLGYLKGQNSYFKWIDLGLRRFLDEKTPGAEAAFASILDMRLRGRIELEIVGRAEEKNSQKMLQTLATLYAPRKIISFINPDDQDYILAHGLEAESYPRLFGCVGLKRRADTADSDRASIERVLDAAWHR